MIEVRCRLTIELDARGGWDLVLWAGEPFDYSTPFRKMLASIADALSQEAPTCIKLPACEDYEDFAEGTLQFGDETIRIYYEHSLSYLVLMSGSADTLRKIADRLCTTYSGRVAVTLATRFPASRLGSLRACLYSDLEMNGHAL